MSQIPWGARSEQIRRWWIRFDQFAFWLSLCGALVALYFSSYPMAICCVCVSFGFVLDMMRDQEKLNAMLRNKPRSTETLTTWVRLRHWQTEIMCRCGKPVHINRAPWCPNFVDPGGGRFSIVCPCGVGYYKLKP